MGHRVELFDQLVHFVRLDPGAVDPAGLELGGELDEFTAALEQSRTDMVAAFEIRQRLDDETPEDEPTKRAMYAEIIRSCRTADDRLDAQVEAGRMPGYVAALRVRGREHVRAGGRTAVEPTTLAGLPLTTRFVMAPMTRFRSPGGVPTNPIGARPVSSRSALPNARA